MRWRWRPLWMISAKLRERGAHDLWTPQPPASPRQPKYAKICGKSVLDQIALACCSSRSHTSLSDQWCVGIERVAQPCLASSIGLGFLVLLLIEWYEMKSVCVSMSAPDKDWGGGEGLHGGHNPY